MSLLEAMERCTPVWQHTVVPGTSAVGLSALLTEAVIAMRHPNNTDGSLMDLSSRILRVFRLLPRQTPNQVGRGSTYHIGDTRLHRRTFMDGGGYNRVFRCEWIHDDKKDKAVLRFVRQDPERDELCVLMAFVETCIHMLLGETGWVVPVIAPLKVERTTDPGYDFGAAIVNPGHGSLFDTITGRKKLTDARIFPLFLLILEALENLQTSHRFVHRDCKSDNIMIVDDPGRTSIDVGNGVSYPIDEKKVQFIDFGYSEVWFENSFGRQRVASDAEDYLVSSGPPLFNDSLDITYFAYITLEDNRKNLSRCPCFLKMLDDIAAPLYKIIRKKHKNYHARATDSRNEFFLKCVYKATKHGSWGPAKLRVQIRDKYWPVTKQKEANKE